MIKLFFIWWHRRRAAHHHAWAVNLGYIFPFPRDPKYHLTWADWYEQQITHLTK